MTDSARLESLNLGDLGPEKGEFVTPGSDKAIALAAQPQPEGEGWYQDPFDPARARFHNGQQWTGLLRKVLTPADRERMQAQVAKKRALQTGVRRRATPSPGLTKHDSTDRILSGHKLVLCSGMECPLAGPVIIALRSNALEIWGTSAAGGHETIQLNRRMIIDVEVAGGEFVTSGGGFIGGGFGVEGAVVGIAAATVLNAVTTRTKREPALLVVMTTEGLVVTSTVEQSALELKGLMAPVFADVLRNRTMPPSGVEDHP